MSVGRIILKSTTKMSLNDRFTVLRRESPTKAKERQSLEERRQAVQASRKNQRLVAQMEQRPAVIAALKLKPNVQNRINSPRKLTVKQRLSMPKRDGISNSTQSNFVRGRGGLRGIRGIRGSIRGRIQRGGIMNRLQTQGRLSGLNGTTIIRGRGTIRGRGRRNFSRSFRHV